MYILAICGHEVLAPNGPARRNLVEVAFLEDGPMTTTAVCNSNFEWMDNAEKQSPCLVSAFLQGACENGQWNVPALIPGKMYNFPNTTTGTSNGCTCSWAVYNLLSACTECQNATAPNWDAYNQQCVGFLSDSTYFPANITYPSETSIPFWASTNPSTWQDGRFNLDKAQSLANEGQPDFNSTSSASPSSSATSSATPSATPGAVSSAVSSVVSKSKSSVGPIVGGVIGGLAALAIAGACAYIFLYKRKRHTSSQEALHLSSSSGHFRSTSNATQRTFGSAGYSGIQQVMASRDNVTSPVSTFTHGASFSAHSGVTSSGVAQPSPSTGIHNHIEPFVGVTGNPELRKGTPAAQATTVAPIGFDQVYADHPHPAVLGTDPDPISFAQAEQATGTNPPPYVESSDPTPTPPRVDEFGHRRLRGEMGSGETVNTRTGVTTTTGGSGSSLAQMGIVRAPTSSNRSDHQLAGVAENARPDEPEL